MSNTHSYVAHVVTVVLVLTGQADLNFLVQFTEYKVPLEWRGTGAGMKVI